MAKDSRKETLQLVKQTYDLIDPSGKNTERILAELTAMTDKEFDAFIEALEKGDDQFTVEMPNMVLKMDMRKLYKAAEGLGLEIFEHLDLIDRGNGMKYRTEHKYAVLCLPIRRTQQFIEKKMSLPDGRLQIDHMTGQVSGAAESSGFGKEEIQILDNRGLHNSLAELLLIRGGNPEAFSNFSHELEETGAANLDTTDPNQRTRVAKVLGVFLRAIHFDNTL